MRQLNRLNQFQRLWQQSLGATQRTCIAEMARHCICSERHMRTLLSQWQQTGWLRWQGESGRGKQGSLEFLYSPEQLRQQLLQHHLQHHLQCGDTTDALKMLDLAPEKLLNLLQPLMGGQWQNNSPVLRVPYYRPLESVQPLQINGRAEQHLVHQLFSGLTRFHHDEPVGDLAHHWQHDAQGRVWLFWLRPQIFWHNDEPIQASQLVAQFEQIIRDPRVRQLLNSVTHIDAPHPLALRFQLNKSDYWLPWHLAHSLCLLPHPSEPHTGSGPWKLAHFTPEWVRIESHARWHLQLPLMQAIEYWITPKLFDRIPDTSCRHPVQIAIGNSHELDSLRPVSRSISVGFCYLVCRPRAGFTSSQARRLFYLIQQSGLIAQLPLEAGLLTPSKELLPGWPVPPLEENEQRLPKSLTLHYHLPVELHDMAHALKKLLRANGCILNVVFHRVKRWQDIHQLAGADLVMGDRLIGDAPVFTLSHWLKLDPLWHDFLRSPQGEAVQQQLTSLQQIASSAARASALHRLYHALMSDGVLLPLFNFRYQISAPPGVEGIQLNALGWFDFNRAWIPPPISTSHSCSAAE